MHTPSLADYVEYLNSGNIEGVGDLMLSSAERLARSGADFLICPDNTIHQAFDYVENRSPLPWLHIAEVVAEEVENRDFCCPALLGTSWLMTSNVYPEKLTQYGRTWMLPSETERSEINRIIMDELVNSEFRPASVKYYQGVIDRMKDDGCDSVILGCTEIPLIIDETNSSLPLLDSTRLLARAALRRAVE